MCYKIPSEYYECVTKTAVSVMTLMDNIHVWMRGSYCKSCWIWSTSEHEAAHKVSH